MTTRIPLSEASGGKYTSVLHWELFPSLPLSLSLLLPLSLSLSLFPSHNTSNLFPSHIPLIFLIIHFELTSAHPPTHIHKHTHTLTRSHIHTLTSTDIPRTNPTFKLFQNKIVQDSLERILYVWAIRHPASGYVQVWRGGGEACVCICECICVCMCMYVCAKSHIFLFYFTVHPSQGINDLLTPFYVVFLCDHLCVEDIEKLSDVIVESIPQNVRGERKRGERERRGEG